MIVWEFFRSPAAHSEFLSPPNMISESGDADHELDASLPRTRLEPQPLLPDATPVDQTHEWTG